MGAPTVEVRGVVNRFGAQVVHDGLDMQVRPGEIFGIVGGSGSGKSGWRFASYCSIHTFHNCSGLCE